MPHADAITMGPPTSHCPALAAVTPSLATNHDKDDAPITVTAGTKGITVETSGASAGRVLAAVALASKMPIEVHGAGASVRIYARVRDAQPEVLLRSVAQVSGLDFAAATGAANGGFIVGHARTAPEIERRMRAARVASAALETRLFPTRDAVGMANVLALTVLSCRGLVTAAPERGLVVVTDVREVIERSAQIADALDASPPKPLRAEMDPVRGPAARPRAPRCANIPSAAAPNGAAGKLFAEGTAAGDLLVRIARAKNEDVVVGCGGDVPAYFSPGSSAPAVADAARAVGMVAEGTNAYASTDLAVAQQAHAGMTPSARADEKHELRTFTAPHVRELAAAADDLLGDPAAAAAYEPASTLVVSASASEVQIIERLVQAWTATH
jgi:type II secretory pathway component GspD/PulD (secretin)